MSEHSPAGLTPEAEDEVERLFHEALDREPSERESFCARATEGEPALAARLLRLVREHERGARDEFGAPFWRPLDTTESALERGQIGPYRLLEPLGEGGMGFVFLAEQESPIRRRVALKILRDAPFGAEASARFRREQQILTRLDHPYIARLLDVGTADDGTPYLAMEHAAEARTLLEYARAEALDRRGKLQLFLRVCEAVEYGHARDVVHRDLKPANLLVRPDGAPVVIDYGISRLLDGECSWAGELTRSGDILGTPLYVSPEQCGSRWGPVGVASDVYSLGVVLYELLTGRLPYDVGGLAAIEVLEVVESAPPTPAAAHDPELRGNLDSLLRRALEKEPRRRYATVAAFASDIEHHLAGRRVRARRAPRAAVPIACALVVGSLVWAGLARQRATQASEPAGELVLDVRSHLRIGHGEGGFSAALEQGSQFGAALAPLGDLDGDGHPDFAVAAPMHDDGGRDRGLAWIVFLDGDARVKRQVALRPNEVDRLGRDRDGASFGAALECVGDLDEDGVPDLVIGALAPEGSQSLWTVFLRVDGTAKAIVEMVPPPNAPAEMPTIDAIADLGDVNGDGSTDVAISTVPFGMGTLFLAPDASCVSSQLFSLGIDGSEGAALAGVGDLDRDGTPDVVVGLPGTPERGVPTGAISVLFLGSNGSASSTTKVDLSSLGLASALRSGDALGAGLAPAGDLDGDGTSEILVSAPLCDDHVEDGGALWVLFLDRSGNLRRHEGIDVSSLGLGGGAALGTDLIALRDPTSGELCAIAAGAPGDSGRGAVYILRVAP